MLVNFCPKIRLKAGLCDGHLNPFCWYLAGYSFGVANTNKFCHNFGGVLGVLGGPICTEAFNFLDENTYES